MVSELLSLIGTKDKNTIIFVMKLALCIISPAFCIIFFFCPQLFEDFGLEVVTILSCTINIVVLLILYWLFSDKIKVIKKIEPVDEKSDYESFIKAKNKCITMVNEDIFNMISNYMITLSIIIIITGLINKYIENIILNIILNIVVIGIGIAYIIYIIFKNIIVKRSAKDLENKFKKKGFLSENK